MGWGWWGVNFPSVAKEGEPRLSYQLPRCGAEGEGAVRLESSQTSKIESDSFRHHYTISIICLYLIGD